MKEDPKEKSSNLWMLSVLPANIASGPLSTLIPLYIILIGGGVMDVSYALTLSSAVSIPAVFIWGYVTDLLNKRKALIVFPYLATSALIASLLFINSVAGITLIYAVIAFVSAATGAPINLLVMENGQKQKWAHNFSLLQMLGTVGITIGYIIACVVTGVSSIGVLLVALAISSLASAFIAAKLIKEPHHIASSKLSLTDSFSSFLYRMVGIPHMLIKIPNPQNIRNVLKFRGFAGSERNFIKIFYLISFVFFFGSAIVNTEYPVSLKLNGISESAIFFLILIASGLQAVIFYYYDHFTSGKSNRVVSALSLVLRGSGYMMIGMSFIYLTGFTLYSANMLLYLLAAGIAYAIYYPTSYAIFFNTISGSRKGSALGLYSAIAGIGTLLGALASGGLIVEYGFGVTFIIAGALMLLTAYLFRVLPKRV